MADIYQLGNTMDGANLQYGGNDVQVSFDTYAGSDMRIFFGPREVGTLMSMTVGITREKAPIYTNLGTGPRAFARGKRAVSGSMVFGQFDRHPLLFGPFSGLLGKNVKDSSVASADVKGVNGAWASKAFGTILQQTAFGRKVPYQYSDQLPPFDVVITFMNENGASSIWKVVGVEIVSEGYGFTQDDMQQDMACSYMAKDVYPMTAMSNAERGSHGNGASEFLP